MSVEGLMALLEKGGFVAPPLVACALALWYAIGFRAAHLWRGSRRPLADLARRARAGEPLRGALGRAVRAARTARTARQRDLTLAETRADLGRYTTLIASVVTIAPLLGLLGTVSGMIETFDALGEMSLFSQSGGIAGGVSEALFSTQLGLAVAIPGLIAGRLLQRRQATREFEIEQLSTLWAEA